MDTTLADLLARSGRTVLDHLDRQAAIPVVDFARQGDVIVIPDRVLPVHGRATTPVPAEGVAVVEGGNTHLLMAEGAVRYDALPAPSLRLGTLTVPVGATAYLLHPEHGAVGLRPGSYTVSRQREQYEVARLVED